MGARPFRPGLGVHKQHGVPHNGQHPPIRHGYDPAVDDRLLVQVPVAGYRELEHPCEGQPASCNRGATIGTPRVVHFVLWLHQLRLQYEFTEHGMAPLGRRGRRRQDEVLHRRHVCGNQWHCRRGPDHCGRQLRGGWPTIRDHRRSDSLLRSTQRKTDCRSLC